MVVARIVKLFNLSVFIISIKNFDNLIVSGFNSAYVKQVQRAEVQT